MANITKKEDERIERKMRLLEASLTYKAGAEIQITHITTDDATIAGRKNPTGRPAIIALWAPEDDEQVTSRLTQRGWEIVNHDSQIPDCGTGEGPRAGAILVPPAR